MSRNCYLGKTIHGAVELLFCDFGWTVLESMASVEEVKCVSRKVT